MALKLRKLGVYNAYVGEEEASALQTKDLNLIMLYVQRHPVLLVDVDSQDYSEERITAMLETLGIQSQHQRR